MSVSAEAREKLARHIDNEAWILHDVPGMEQRPEAQALLVEKSLEIADSIIESGIMASENWDRAEYFRAMARIKSATSRELYCTGIYGNDVKHSVQCKYWPDKAWSGSDCITEQAVRRCGW